MARHATIGTRRLFGLVAAFAVWVGLAEFASAASVQVDVNFDHAVLRANERQSAYLHVGLTGLGTAGPARRAPLNVAIVIDKSGSMAGRKIAQAKEAALAALSQLGPEDIVSVVAYDTTVTVLVPATKASDRASIIRGIKRLRAGGTTALFAGTVKGAEEVRKFLDPTRVNRVVLLSDGLANVGPSTPDALGSLGMALRREGISVTTVGLGLDYNEDLMVALARQSGGSFTFAEDAEALVRLYRDGFGSLSRIVAKGLVVRIELTPGIRPVRSLGYEAEIVGQTVIVPIAQVYGGTTEQVVIEVETPPLPASRHRIGTVDVRYDEVGSEGRGTARYDLDVAFSDRPNDVEASVNDRVMVAVVERIAAEKSQTAIKLRDKGQLEAARRTLNENSVFLDQNAKRFGSSALRNLQQLNDSDAQNIEGERWNAQRKRMQQRRMSLEIQGF